MSVPNIGNAQQVLTLSNSASGLECTPNGADPVADKSENDKTYDSEDDIGVGINLRSTLIIAPHNTPAVLEPLRNVRHLRSISQDLDVSDHRVEKTLSDLAHENEQKTLASIVKQGVTYEPQKEIDKSDCSSTHFTPTVQFKPQNFAPLNSNLLTSTDPLQGVREGKPVLDSSETCGLLDPVCSVGARSPTLPPTYAMGEEIRAEIKKAHSSTCSINLLAKAL